MNCTQARRKILGWPDLYRYAALENIRDAEHDLVQWPDLRTQILRDMTQAIKEWENIMNTPQHEDGWPEICPLCHSDIGHRVNCPNGIAFSK